MQKTFKTIVLAGLMALSFHTLGHADALSSWALPEYTKAASSGIITYNVVTKNLKESITREEFCELSVALYEKFSGKGKSAEFENPFTDCSNPAVVSAFHYGLVSGTSTTTFEPSRFVTRQEMAKILENVLKASDSKYEVYNASSKLPLFNDSDLISDWAVPSISMVSRYSIMSGSDGNFNPQGKATREQAILSVYRAYNNFSDGNQKNYTMKCVSPAEGAVIVGGEAKVNCSSIGKAKNYFVIIKDANGNPVKNMTIAMPSAFRINKATLPYGENYSIIMGAVLSDGSEIYSPPVNFSFKEPPKKEADKVEAPAPTPTPEEIKTTEKVETEKTEVTQTPAPTTTPSTGAAVQNNITSNATENAEEDTEEDTKKETETQKPDMTIGFEDEVMSDKAKALIQEAEKYIGIPYVYGGTTPDGFDCSGYVKYVFEKFGITLKRVSRDQYAYCGTKVERKDLQPGDLVFFGTGGVVGHVGIYTGNGQMIHSPSTGKSICYTSIESNYYVSHYIGAKRIF